MKTPYIVTVSGGSASGKTTFADRLAERLADLRIKTLHMDSYFREASARPTMTGLWDGRTYIDDNHPQTLDLDQFHRDYQAALAEGWQVVMVEGVFSLWDETLLSQSDLKLYVDCDSDERMARRVKRHLACGQDLEEITTRYVQAVQPRHREYVEPLKWRADLILNGFQPSQRAYDMVEQWIRARAADFT